MHRSRRAVTVAQWRSATLPTKTKPTARIGSAVQAIARRPISIMHGKHFLSIAANARSISTTQSCKTLTTIDSNAADAQQVLARYSQLPSATVTLPDLTRFGPPPLSESELIESAERTRQDLLVGLAKRVRPKLRRNLGAPLLHVSPFEEALVAP